MENNFGCFYNPRPSPGRCIKDTRSNTVEGKCKIVNNACKLNQTSLPDIKIEENKDRLSGPISAYVTKIGDKSFNFFGDAHFSTSKNCKFCQDIDLSTFSHTEPLGSKNCWDISVLLSKTFTQASKENKWIDFYIELPFIFDEEFSPSQKGVGSLIDKFGYMNKLYYIFYNCLNKLSCKYNTTRFHYVDVRLEYKKVDLSEITEELEKLIESRRHLVSYTNKIVNYEMTISMERLNNSLEEFAKMIYFDDRTSNKIIETTDKLMRDLYFSGGQTMAGKIDAKNIRLFDLYLSSDNFSEEATSLMKESLIIANDPTLNLILASPTMIVNRRGKNMHRVRAQLEALENEGQKKLAKDIYDFMLSRYINNDRTNNVIDLWRGIMIAYDGFINAKYRSSNDVNMLLHRFQSEAKKMMQTASFSVSGAALIMDAYTLGRMFRTFPGKNHTNSVKSIVYAGDAHISTYVDFFEFIGNKFIKYQPNKKIIEAKEFDKLTRCINVNINDFNL